MESLSFTPRVQQVVDPINIVLTKITHYILLAVFGFLPILCIPTPLVLPTVSKIFIVTIAIVIAAMAYCLSLLRARTITISLPYVLFTLLALVGAALFSAIVSGDFTDSFWTTTFSMQGVFGLAVIATSAILATIVSSERSTIIRTYALLLISAVVLALWHGARLLTGLDLSGGVFGSTTSTPIGSWNDLGLFYGLVIISLLVALAQLRLTTLQSAVVGVVTVLSLLMLAVINFSAIWIALCFISITVLVSYIARSNIEKTDTLPTISQSESAVWPLLVTSALVFVVSASFLVGGTFFSNAMSSATGISYVEVRPSFEATTAIAASVFADQFWSGVGPARFVDAWRLYKDASINETIFWNTSFNSGYSYILTSVIEIGVLGVIAWFGFYMSLLWRGVRVLISRTEVDPQWSFVLVSSFVVSVYVWGMALISVPGPSLLLLGAVATGFFVGASRMVLPQRSIQYSMTQNKRAAFVVVGVALLAIVGGVSTLSAVTKQVVAAGVAVNGQRALATDIDQSRQLFADSYTLWQNDEVLRIVAQIEYQTVETLLRTPEPSVVEQQAFQTAVVGGINAAQQAVNIDPTDALNQQLLGRMYALVATTGLEGSGDRARAAYNAAIEIDPKNPELYFLLSQLDLTEGNTQAARDTITQAIQLKRNYTEALYSLAQIEVADGNVDQAIAATQAVLTFDPNNPARYYQLGVLYFSEEQYGASEQLFSTALELSPEYANARYLRALTNQALDNTDAAIADLEIVSAQNPENEIVVAQLELLRNGATVVNDSELPARPLIENDVTSDEQAVILGDDVVAETDLIAPINGSNIEVQE